MKPILCLGLLLTPLLLASSGCANVSDKQVATRLEVATTGYRQSIRWGYWDAAVGLIHPSKRAGIDVEPLENIRVTSYEVVEPPVVTEDNKAFQVARIEYVLNDRQRLLSLADRQEWRYEEEAKSWWLHSGLPKFKLD